MKRPIILIMALAVSACAAYVTPQGTYIEPLFPSVVIGPPVVAPPPSGIVVAPLPPVYVVPDRHLYFYGSFYYYNWQGGWYWSRHQQGPWHELPRDRWPSRVERRGYERDRGEHERGRERGY